MLPLSRAIPFASLVTMALLGCGAEPAPGDAGSGSSASSSGGGLAMGGSGGVGGATSTGGTAGTAGSGVGGSGGAGGTSGGAAGSGGAGGTTGGSAGASGAGGGGASGSGGGGSGGSPGSECPGNGAVTYTLMKEAQPTAEQQEAYDAITEAMDTAVEYYNCYTDIEKTLYVTYNPSVATADGNENGSIRFGKLQYMHHVTAMHEISHTVGIGNPTFDSMIVNGVFTGEVATAKLREITGDPEAEVHGDTQHFWPYGLNQQSEAMSEQDLIDHCAMVVAIRVDLGF